MRGVTTTLATMALTCAFASAATPMHQDAQALAQALLAVKSAPQDDQSQAKANDDVATRLQATLPSDRLIEVARTRELAAELYSKVGRNEEARSDLLLAIALRQSLRDSGPELFGALVKLGQVDLAMNDLQSAGRAFNDALSLGTTLYGSDSRSLIPALAGQAEIAERQGHAADTKKIRERIEVLSTTVTPIEQAVFDGVRGPTTGTGRLFGPQLRYGAGKGDFARVKVFFGTDRNAIASAPRQVAFDATQAAGLSYGWVEVSIPPSHNWGALESSTGAEVEGAIDDPHLYVLKLSGGQLSRSGFIDALHKDETAANWREAFVFVHGYNTSFDDAARRTAQLAYDLRFPGTPLFFSWPSAGSVAAYWNEEQVVKQSALPLEHFLRDLITQGNFERIHILAHSMGNRVVLKALSAIAAHPIAGNPKPFDQLIFAAPDVAQADFAGAIPKIVPIAKRLTLYASSNDLALTASEIIHNGVTPAGLAGANMLVLRNLDSIDMSDVVVDSEFVGHSYFGSSPAVMEDIVQLTWRDAAPNLRCGMKTTASNRWHFSGDACPPELLEAASAVKRWNENAPKQISDYLNDLSQQSSERRRWTQILALTKQLLASH